MGIPPPSHPTLEGGRSTTETEMEVEPRALGGIVANPEAGTKGGKASPSLAVKWVP